MSRAQTIQRFWDNEWSLSVLLGLLVFDGFVIRPLVEYQEASAVLGPLVFSLLLVSGVAATMQRRSVSVIVGALVAVSLATRWASHVHPTLDLVRADCAASLAFVVLLTSVILAQVFRPGAINIHRIQGAIAVYLLLAFAWGLAYELVALSNPDAFNLPATVPRDPPHIRSWLLYFSLATLTTVGYGDVTPVSPVARALAGLEALTGQLFPAILLARLVSMELYHHLEKRGR